MISHITSALTAAQFNSVAVSHRDLSTVDSATGVRDLFTHLVQARIYPLTLPASPQLPCMTYTPVGREYVESDGEKLGRVDRYQVRVYAASFAELQSLCAAMSVVVAASGEQVEITDMRAEYQAADTRYQAELELTFTMLTTASQSVPAALVYPLKAEADSNTLGNGVSQRVVETVAVVLVCAPSALDAARQACADALLGQAFNTQAEPLVYQSGERIAHAGDRVFWREQFSYARHLRA